MFYFGGQILHSPALLQIVPPQFAINIEIIVIISIVDSVMLGARFLHVIFVGILSPSYYFDEMLTKLQTNYFFCQIGSLRNISFVENDTQCSGIYCLLSSSYMFGGVIGSQR